MQHWSELRTAWLIPKLGTISAAVEMLYILRATVTGRVDTLEAAFGTRLFR